MTIQITHKTFSRLIFVLKLEFLREATKQSSPGKIAGSNCPGGGDGGSAAGMNVGIDQSCAME